MRDKLSSVIIQENENARWWIEYALGITQYSWVMPRLIGFLDSSINGMQIEEQAPYEEQGWLAWGFSAVAKTSKYIPAFDGIDICHEIIIDRQRRIKFFKDPATHKFLKEQKELPAIFFEALKKEGVIDRMLSKHDEGNYKHVAGKLLQDKTLVDKVLKIPEAISENNIKQFFDILYAPNDPKKFRKLIAKTLKEIKKNAELRNVVYEIVESLPGHSVDLAKLLPYLGANDRERDLLAQPFMEEVLFHILRASSYVSASDMDKLVNILGNKEAKIGMKDISSLLKSESVLPLLSSLSDILSIASKHKDDMSKLLDPQLPETLKPFGSDVIIDISNHMMGIISHINHKQIEILSNLVTASSSERNELLFVGLPKLLDTKVNAEVLSHVTDVIALVVSKKEEVKQLASKYVDKKLLDIALGDDVISLADFILKEEKTKTSSSDIRIIDLLLDSLSQNKDSFKGVLELDVIQTKMKAFLSDKVPDNIGNALLSLVPSALDRDSTYKLAKTTYHIRKESDPEKLVKHTESLVHNCLDLLAHIDLYEVKKAYQNKDDAKFIDHKIGKILEDFGIKVDSHEVVKFILNNQKSISKFQEKKSMKGIIFAIARNPVLGGQIFINNRKLLFTLMKKQSKTKYLEDYVKDVIKKAREGDKDVKDVLDISAKEEEFKNDRIVKYFNYSFTGIDFTRMNLNKSFDFSEVKMTKVLFDGSKVESSFKEAKLTSCSFANCNLKKANFEGVELNQVSFKGSQLSQKVVDQLEQARDKMDEYTRKSFDEAKKNMPKKKLSFRERLKLSKANSKSRGA